MGKGGYLGGSTILYINGRKASNIDELAPMERLFRCKICNNSFSYTEYFGHLSAVHGLKACISCGYPYKYDGEESHTCEQCGKFIRLRFHKENIKNSKSEKKVSRVCNKYNNAPVETDVRSEKNIKNKINNNKKQQIVVSKKIRKSTYRNDEVKKDNDKFGVSIKDILSQAMLNKK